jgi:hypothetical protein
MPDLGADEFELPHRPPQQESEAHQRSALAHRLESLISEIRKRPGCAGLFSPPGFARLKEAVGRRSAVIINSRRSAVIINISEYRCDAITVTSAGAAAVPLPSLSRQDAEDAAEFFRDTAENAVRSGWVGHRPERNRESARMALGRRVRTRPRASRHHRGGSCRQQRAAGPLVPGGLPAPSRGRPPRRAGTACSH